MLRVRDQVMKHFPFPMNETSLVFFRIIEIAKKIEIGWLIRVERSFEDLLKSSNWARAILY